MKAVFKGYNKIEHFFNFTKGNVYDVNILNDGLIQANDDDGHEVVLANGATYSFDIINDFIKKPASLKYFINDIPVERGFFYESIDELNEATRIGVKVPSIRFEIKFE